MKIQLLPTTFDSQGNATKQQHTCCFLIDDSIAVDAGSLATATTLAQKEKIRDVVLSHAHLDHIAGLPLFLDDLFTTLRNPINIHATEEVINALEEHIFNWIIYPRFSELNNKFGRIINYKSFSITDEFQVNGVNFKAVKVNHKVPTVGFVLSQGASKIAITNDTAEMHDFWDEINEVIDLKALLIECAFPDGLEDIAHSSHHLTPKILANELRKFRIKDCPVFVVNIKPMYRDKVCDEIEKLKIENLHILEVGKIYEF